MTQDQLRAGADQCRKVGKEIDRKLAEAGFPGMVSEQEVGLCLLKNLFQGVGQVLDAMADAAPDEVDQARKA